MSFNSGLICGKCSKFLTYLDDDVMCDGFCNHRFHISCVQISIYSKQTFFKNKNVKWFCDSCCSILKNLKEIYDLESSMKTIKISKG